MPDQFVREVVRELAPELRRARVVPHEARELAIPVNNDLGLSAFHALDGGVLDAQ